jgi:hypothetical protein
VNAERTEGESVVVADFVASDACACAGVPPGVGVPLVVYDEELFAGVDNSEGGPSCGEARVGGEENTTAAAGGEEDAGAAPWLASGITFDLLGVREEANAAFVDARLADDGDLVEPGADNNDDDAFDFPLSVEW